MISPKRLNQILYGIIILFCATPFVFFFYINNMANSQNLSLAETLQSNPMLTLQMFAIFLLPLAAYLLKLKWEKVVKENKVSLFYLSVLLLMIGLFLAGHTLHGILLFVFLILMTRHYSFSLNEIVKLLKLNRSFISNFSGELFMIIISVFISIMFSRLN